MQRELARNFPAVNMFRIFLNFVASYATTFRMPEAPPMQSPQKISRVITFSIVIPAAALLVACNQPSSPVNGVAAVPDAAAVNCAESHALLIPDTGTFSRPIGTQTTEAQAYFDQGLRLTYSYYFPEAISSFDAALCFEPGHPMIHWGRALAIGPNPNSRYGGATDDPQGEGWQTIGRARTATEGLSEIERGLIDTLAVLLDTQTNAEQEARTLAFVEAASALYQDYPDDHEAAFLLAHGIMMTSPWNYFDAASGAPLNRMPLAMDVMEKGMRENPEHPGLTHLHIHLMEASRQPGRAEPSADRLESLTPMAGHMVHMPGHIYMRTGRYDDAIASNERSVAADEYFVEQWAGRPLPRFGTYFLSATNHAGHARMFIHWAGVLQGNYQRAMSIAEPMAMMAAPEALDRGASLRNVAILWTTMKAFGRWEDILAIEEQPDTRPYLQGMRSFVRGSALLARADIAGAEQELTAIRSINANPALASMRAGVNTTADLLNIAMHSLAGEIAAAQSDFPKAIAEFEQAVSLQDALRYMEPPDWIQSTRLFLGQVLLDAGEPAGAETVFMEDLVLLEENGWSLFGLTKALEAQGKTAEADAARQRFERAWAKADLELTRAHL
jgi:tetratricopeptide (TPR) repeat protein